MNAEAPIPDVREALQFLLFWSELTSVSHITLTGIIPDGSTETATFKRGEGERLTAWIAAKQQAGRNIYYTLNETRPGCNSKPRKTDIIAAHARWADIDPDDKTFSLRDERDRLLRLAEHLANDPDFPPSAIVDTGNGLQPIWAIARAELSPDIVSRVEAQTASVEAALGAGGTANVDRLLRLPGTTNYPNAVKRDLGRGVSRARLIFSAPNLYSTEQAATLGEHLVARLTGTGLVRPKHRPASEPGRGTDPAVAALIEQLQAAGADKVTALAHLPDDLQSRLRAALQTSGEQGLCNAPKTASLAERWNGLIDDLTEAGRDDSRSGADMSLAAMLKHAGFTHLNTALILCAYKHGKANGNDWPSDALRLRHVARCAIRSHEPELRLSPGTPLHSARELVRLAYTHSDGRTLNHQQSTFYHWQGSHYAEASDEHIRATVYSFLDRAKREADKKLTPFNPNRTSVTNVIDALAAVTQLPARSHPPVWLNETPNAPATEYLACANGLLHLPSRKLTRATPAFFSLTAVNYPYEPHAPTPPLWLDFLKQIWPDDQASIDTLQEIFGLLLTPDTSQEKAFLLIGPPRSGRGTVARVLTAMLGSEHVAGPTLHSLTEPFGLEPLIHKTLAIISDARLGRSDASVAVERLLTLTGEDTMTVNRKNRRQWTGRLSTRIAILSNELPRLTDASGAIASRFIVLLMTISFLGREDPNLTTKLTAQLPGILNWAIDGRDRLIQRGYFVQPASARKAADQMADLASPISAFVRERCDVGPEYSVDVGALFAEWINWCAQQHRDHAGTVQTFGRDLRAAVPGMEIVHPRDKNGKPTRAYQGVRISPDAQ
jgi:putative DNA primase/helicase